MNDLGYPKLMRDMTIGLILAAAAFFSVLSAVSAINRVNHAYQIARV